MSAEARHFTSAEIGCAYVDGGWGPAAEQANVEGVIDNQSDASLRLHVLSALLKELTDGNRSSRANTRRVEHAVNRLADEVVALRGDLARLLLPKGQPDHEVLAAAVDTLPLTTRIRTVLAANHIATVEDLIGRSASELESLAGISVRSVRIIKTALAQYGLSLRRERC